MSTPDELGKRTHSIHLRFGAALRNLLPAQFASKEQTYFPGKAAARKKRVTVRDRVVHGIKRFLPDSVFVLLSHRKRVGRFPNLKNPATFNEIILDRCLHPDPLWSTLTDKLAVREYVKSKVGEKHLIPLLAAPEVFTQEVFDSLPASFVMKANHGCGFVKVVRDKSSVSFEQLNELADEWLSTNFYLASRERHYRSIKPRIYFEKLLLDRSGAVPADFKMNIFGRKQGDPIIYTGVVSDRFGSPRHDFYDAQWNRLDIVLGEYPCSTVPAPPLPNWDEVVRIATLLADGLGYVRVDLYAPDNEIFFGELTFTPGAGVSRFSPDHYDYEWGRLIKEMPPSQVASGTRETLPQALEQ